MCPAIDIKFFMSLATDFILYNDYCYECRRASLHHYQLCHIVIVIAFVTFSCTTSTSSAVLPNEILSRESSHSLHPAAPVNNTRTLCTSVGRSLQSVSKRFAILAITRGVWRLSMSTRALPGKTHCQLEEIFRAKAGKMTTHSR